MNFRMQQESSIFSEKWNNADKIAEEGNMKNIGEMYQNIIPGTKIGPTIQN